MLMRTVATYGLRVRWAVGLLAWSGALYGALSLAHIPGDWGHALCGPWGCAPPLQALISCHLAWLVFLLPPAMLTVSWLPKPARAWFGSVLLLVGCGLVIGLAAKEALFWLQEADPEFSKYLPQRVGFVFATNVDLPAWQLIVVGIACRWIAFRFRDPSQPPVRSSEPEN